MHIGVVEPDERLRAVWCYWMEEEGYSATGYISFPSSYDLFDFVLFGPGFIVPQAEIELLERRSCPYIQLAYFENMDKILERIKAIDQALHGRSVSYQSSKKESQIMSKGELFGYFLLVIFIIALMFGAYLLMSQFAQPL